MGWQQDATAAARRYGVDPALYRALIYQESRGVHDVTSGKGAMGYAQLMPGTAQELGVDPRDPIQNLNGGAKYLSQQLKAFNGDVRLALAAYNAGPGAVRKAGGIPQFAETQNYVKSIMGALGGGYVSSASQRRPSRPAEAPGSSSPATAAVAAPDFGAAQSIAGTVASLMNRQRPVGAASALPAPSFATRPAMAGATVQGGGGPAPRADIGALIDANRTPGQAAASVAASASPLVAEASSAPASRPRTGTDGAQAALGWAQSKIGFREATGNNDGGLAGYLNQRYGFSNAPWCAMFTSSAVTKGGAPAAARTASVEEVRRQAVKGGGGYQKGFVDGNRARAGDLILWGNRHIGMVESVKDGVIRYVAGNEGNAVARGTARVGTADIVRPLYGRR